MLAEAETTDSSISLIARRYGLASSLLFRWRQLRDGGSLTGLQAGEPVVGESEVQRLKHQVRELQRLVGKKAEENEILRAAIELAREKNCSRPQPCQNWKVCCERGGTSARGLAEQPDA